MGLLQIINDDLQVLAIVPEALDKVKLVLEDDYGIPNILPFEFRLPVDALSNFAHLLHDGAYGSQLLIEGDHLECPIDWVLALLLLLSLCVSIRMESSVDIDAAGMIALRPVSLIVYGQYLSICLWDSCSVVLRKVILVLVVLLLQHRQCLLYDYSINIDIDNDNGKDNANANGNAIAIAIAHYNAALYIQMFQNSFLNKVNVKCGDHPKNLLTHICIDSKCQSSPLFCQECISNYKFKEKHYSHELSVLQLNAGITQIATRIEQDKKPINAIYKTIISQKSNESLLKWQEEKEQHFMSIEKHLNTLKFQIEEEITNILRKFQDELHAQKLALYVQLQNYYKNYKDRFQRFSRMTDPIVSMNNKFKFYSSRNPLIFKMCSEINQTKLKGWIVDLKKTLFQTERAVREPQQYSQQIKKLGVATNQLIDDLPRIRSADYEVELPLILNNLVRQIFKSLVRLKEVKHTVCRSISMNSIPHQSMKWKNSYNY